VPILSKANRIVDALNDWYQPGAAGQCWPHPHPVENKMDADQEEKDVEELTKRYGSGRQDDWAMHEAAN
jgi:hypothetical protein